MLACYAFDCVFLELPKGNPNSWRLMSDIEGLNKPEILSLEFQNCTPKISTIFKSNRADIYWKKAEFYQSNDKKKTHTHTHIHAPTHTHIHTRIHTPTPTHIHTRTQTHAHAHAHAHIHTSKDAASDQTNVKSTYRSHENLQVLCSVC